MPAARACTLLIAVFAACIMACASAAQDLGSLRNAAGNLLGQKGSGPAMPTVSSLGSARNAAGVLGYCQSHGYLPSATATLKEKLLGKFGGSSQAAQDNGYKQGVAGILQGGNGHSFDLGNLKGTLARQTCKHVADKAVSSFLH